ncbi:STAS domain-containing protein [Nonomuraea jabiensis]|uniref:STAS domain-containing protein n=1 Tax=Nonomuraea jabiensis TaxID=882448 RepID=UPI00367D3653
MVKGKDAGSVQESGMARLSPRICAHPECWVVSLDGELDAGTKDTVVEACTRLLQQGHVKLVVDVSNLSFCDCSGVDALIALQGQAEQQGGYLRLIGVHGSLARLLTVGELIDTFPPYRDLRQACG